MIVLRLYFARKKYHATEWGRNVNEGFVDWPPAPWRLLRAIISSWKTCHHDIPKDVVWPMLQAMLSSRVSYKLPPARVAHTRHYVPLASVDAKMNIVKEERILDTFIVVGDQPVFAIWEDASLDKIQREVLLGILGDIRYIGRSESLCSVTLVDEEIVPNCTPMNGPGTKADVEITNVLTPKKNTSLEKLCIRTSALKSEKRTYPMETELIPYVRPSGCLSAIPPTPTYDPLPRVTAVRYAITGKPRPLVTDTITIGDSFKRAAMSKYGGLNGDGMSHVLSGRQSRDGSIMLDNHSHAFFLPTDEDNDGRLDHMTVAVSAGYSFEPDVTAALMKIKRIQHGPNALQVTYLARGQPGNFKIVPILQRASSWISDTPYVPNRHIKRNGGDIKDGPMDQIRREAAARGLPHIKRIKVTKAKKIHGFPPFQFKKYRKRGLQVCGGAYSVRIEFAEKVQGPVSFGYASHFGLGMFVPKNDAAVRNGGQTSS